jgi:hypothetical protein
MSRAEEAEMLKALRQIRKKVSKMNDKMLDMHNKLINTIKR